jgi:hypothetical protein
MFLGKWEAVIKCSYLSHVLHFFPLCNNKFEVTVHFTFFIVISKKTNSLGLNHLQHTDPDVKDRYALIASDVSEPFEAINTRPVYKRGSYP